MYGEVNLVSYFSTVLGPRELKPFEVNYQYVGTLPDLDILFRLDVLFAGWTVPFIVVLEAFDLQKLLETIENADFA